MSLQTELSKLEAKYNEVMKYTNNLKKELNNNLQYKFGDDALQKEYAKTTTHRTDVENISRCIEYSRKIYEKIEECKRKFERGSEKDITNQIILFKQLFKYNRENMVLYKGDSTIYKSGKYERSNITLNFDTKIVTDSRSNPLSILHNFTIRDIKAVMVNPLSTTRGGCVVHGQRGVEEDISLQTNYWKALGKYVVNGIYQLNEIGDMAHFPSITRIRDGNFKWLSESDRSQVDMIGVKFPHRLDAYVNDSKLVYENQSDKIIIENILDDIFDLCVKLNYEVVVFNNIGTNYLYYPEDDFIDILKHKLSRYKFKIFVFCGFSGDVDLSDKVERLTWIKYCTVFDNTTKLQDRKDVDPPKYDDPPEYVTNRNRDIVDPNAD